MGKRRSFVDSLSAADAQTYVSILRQGAMEGRSATWVQERVSGRFGGTIGQTQSRAHLRRTKSGEDPAEFLFANSLKETGRANQEKVEHKKTGDDSAVLETLSGTVRTVEDALKKGNIDLNVWEVERCVVNSWEVGAKGPEGKIVVSPLWQVKVWLKAKMGWSPSEFRKLLVEDLRALAPSYETLIYEQERQPIMAELSLFDAHFGKLAWEPETGQSYDLKICRDRYMMAGRDLLKRVEIFQPERILYIVGNDFYHADQGRIGATTNGTPQDCDGRWQKAFRIGMQCAISLAEEAAQLCKVHILVVPGNHDAEKAFCLGEVLAARFHQHPDITVQNDPDVHAYYRYGTNLIGFVHGDNHTSDKKRDLLPQTMATDRPQEWAETTCREIHLGHFHSELEEIWKYRRVQHVKDVAVRVLPSLSSTDAWHRRSGYASVLAAECHLYHRDHGKFGFLVHQAKS